MTMPEPEMTNPILVAALDAWDHGLSVVRVRSDGSKRPVGEWKAYQTDRAERAVVQEWFAHGNHGLGVICGAVSGDLEMLELEGRFIAEIGTQAFKDAAKAAGLELLLSRLVNGFMVVSPSNGRHFYYRVDGEAAPNTKLARRPATDDELAASDTDRVKVLIETRGEGGFVVAPPSSGTVHPPGRPWQTQAATWAAVPTITVAERDAMFELCRSFDTAGHAAPTPVAPVATPVVVRQARATVEGSSWMDALVDHLRTTQPMQQLLEHYGWAHAYTDRHGRALMTRPGKDEGVSGSVNAGGRLLPFSSSTPFATGGLPPTTYDQLDVIAAYEYRGDRKAAARSLAERAGLIGAPARPPANVDPTTGEIVSADNGPLDEAFWNARPYLTHIRQAARSRMVAPAAVLGCVLARVAAFTPPSTCLPPTIGSESTLTTYVALLAVSGGGKSTSMGCAASLLPDTPPGCLGPLGLGSGEGLIDAYFEMVEDTDGGGKKQRVKRHTKHGVLFSLDEGQALAEMGARKGATIMPILRSAWSGSDIGQANAGAETRRTMRQGTYTAGLISLWQMAAAAKLLKDVDGGTPQRFVFISTTDATLTVDTPEWPGALRWTPPPAIVMHGRMQANPMAVHADIAAEIRSTHVAVQTGQLTLNPFDSHRRLVKLKLAGLLAVLDERHDIDLDDWELAERIMTHSDQMRSWVQQQAALERARVEESVVRRRITHEAMAEDSATQRAMALATKAVARAAQRLSPAPLTRRHAHMAVSGRHRQIVTLDEVLAEAERLQWLTRTGDNEWELGNAAPR